jgi:hypothetical protein
MTYRFRRLRWQGLQKGTAVAGADAIGCGRCELGGNRVTGCSGRESSRMLRRFPPRSPFATDPAQIGDAGRGARHRGPLQELFDGRDVRAGEACRLLGTL